MKAVFFDIGNTLGTVSKDADKFILNPFDTTQAFLRSFQDALGFKLGIITNILPEMTDDVARQLLAAAGFLTFFNDGAIVTNRDAGVRKPNVKTYQQAAQRAGLPVNQGLYVGEDPKEVAGAQKAGMAGLLKPFQGGACQFRSALTATIHISRRSNGRASFI